MFCILFSLLFELVLVVPVIFRSVLGRSRCCELESGGFYFFSLIVWCEAEGQDQRLVERGRRVGVEEPCAFSEGKGARSV